jgi:glucose/arabinose dehydrogenase
VRRVHFATLAVVSAAALLRALAGCNVGDPPMMSPPDGGGKDADAAPPPVKYDANVPSFCDLAGSVVWQGGKPSVVPGAEGLPDLTWMRLPDGFCAHWYGKVPNARQIRFAPGRELFVASPSRGTTGGGGGGLASIMVLPDDDLDGLADANLTYRGTLPATQGLLFHGSHFYYQDETRVVREPYQPGQRTTTGTAEVLVDIQFYASPLHWPKAIDVADDGRIFVTNGGDQNDPCNGGNPPLRGAIVEIDGTPQGRLVARGFRNPFGLRCERGKGVCFTTELTKDYTAAQGGREKLVPIRYGDDWGFPCCAARNLPFPDVQPTPSCGFVAEDTVGFFVGHTPFGLEFVNDAPGWPDGWKNRVYVALHGVFGTWEGARVVAIQLDPLTGMPLPASTIGPDGGPGATGAIADFAVGWDDGKLAHGRPADVTLASDGRLFLADDNLGAIVWIAPIGLPRK